MRILKLREMRLGRLLFSYQAGIYIIDGRAQCKAQKKDAAKGVFFAFGENYASYFLKSNAPLCPPNPKFVLIATFTSAFLATFGT